MNKFVRYLLRASVLPLATIGISSAAVANEGLYLSAEGGFNFQPDQNLTHTGPNATYSFKDKDGFIGGFGIGYSYLKGWRNEIVVDYRRNRFNDRTDGGNNTSNISGYESVYTAIGSMYYDLHRPTGFFSVVHPYIGGGLGAARVELRSPVIAGVQNPNSFDTVFAYQGGTGVGVDVSRNLTLTVDYRYLQTQEGDFIDNGSSAKARYRSHSALIGLRYFFHTPTPRLIPVAEPVQAATPPPPAPPPRAPVDSDGDGVIDELDKCANTPHGFRVDADGCIVEQTTILRNVNFVFNSDRLTAAAQDTLNGVAEALIGQPSLDVQITGHTDSVGKEKYNQKLSQKRADSVRRYLTSKGVNASNLQAKGLGEGGPIASNDTAEGRAENRRVEFIVLNKPANVKVEGGDSTQESKDAAEKGEPAHIKNRK